MTASSAADRRPAVGTASHGWLANRFAIISRSLVLVYLFVPVAYTFAFSFNDSGKSNIVWNSAASTLKHWQDPCGAPGVCEALVTSLQVGVDRDARGDGARHDARVRAGAATVPRPRRPATCSSSCRWRRPRSCSARAC